MSKIDTIKNFWELLIDFICKKFNLNKLCFYDNLRIQAQSYLT